MTAFGYAIPLMAASPEWLTDQLLAQVLAAQGAPVAAPNDAPLPGVVGIRPGGWMISPAGCTMNFIFQDQQGDLAIGTAGHCVNQVGESVVLLTIPPDGGAPVLVDIGTVIIQRNAGIGEDFALVKIRPELYSWVSPTIAIVGGPCGEYLGSGPEVVFHYGHGLAIGTGGTPRAGVALTWTEDAFGWDGLGIFGDSGSPVRVSDFKAAGNLTHLVVDPFWLPSFIAGTRITRILEIARGWRLVGSPLCIDVLQSVEALIVQVGDANLGQRQRPLIASLNAAVASFEAGRTDTALNQLRAFQNKIRAQLGRSDPNLAETLIQAAQEIIDPDE